MPYAKVLYRGLPSASLAVALMIFMGVFGAPAAVADDLAKTLETKCTALANADFSGTQDAATDINYAKWVPASGELPAHCEIDGYVTPSVGFLFWLPDDWNGKFIEMGCGGSCGTLKHIASCTEPLRRGYACIVTDMGHRNRVGTDLWAYGNPQAQMDYAFRATHVTALSGKAILKAYYGRPAADSYHQGCSCGGWQGLKMAQRFPSDFDGIIAGAPAISYSDLAVRISWIANAVRDPNGRPLFDDDSVQLIHDAVINQCDGLDGLKDGLISMPSRCKFDPSVLACKAGESRKCLSREQVAAAQKLYSAPHTSTGQKLAISGFTLGAELSVIGIKAQESWFSARQAQQIRYLGLDLAPVVSWKMSDFDFDHDPQRLGVADSLLSADNPDLRRFKARGGKLILYSGWADAAISPASVIDYYRNVERLMGGRENTQSFFRLFLIPGMDHCSLGGGPSDIDYLTYLEAWVERNRPPDVMIGTHAPHLVTSDGTDFRRLANDSSAYARPIYPYPLEVRYKGSGDPTKASSFISVQPQN